MRRTAGIVLGLSVVGCQGLAPMRHQYVQVYPMGSMGTPSGYIQPPAQPQPQPAMLPVIPQLPPSAPTLPPAGTVSNPQAPSVMPAQPIPSRSPMQGEPPLAPMGPNTMNPMDPQTIAMLQAQARAMQANTQGRQCFPQIVVSEDPEAKRLQMELTKEMVQQIVALRKKVEELSADSQPKTDVGQSKVTPASATVPAEPETPRPAPKSEPVETKVTTPAPLPKIVAEEPTPVAPAPKPVAATPPAPPTPSPEEIAARNLQMELTRELGRQVIELKQKVGDLRGDVETWAEAGRQKQEKEMQQEVLDLRVQIAQLHMEMARLKAPAPVEKVEPVDVPKTSAPDLTVPPPEEAAPVVPYNPTGRTKRPAVRESLPQKEYNRRFADALSEIRTEVEELKASFQTKIVDVELIAANEE